MTRPRLEQACPDDVPDRFGPIAGFYDVVDIVFSHFKRDPRMAVAEAVPATAERILDLGTGTGSALVAVARARPGAEVVGLDASERMLAVASRKVARLKAKGVTCAEPRLVCGSAANLPFDDEDFDVVTGSLFFHELPPEVRQTAFDEAERVLAPGGLMVILDLDRRPEGWRSPAQWMLERFEEDYAWQLSGDGLAGELEDRGLIDITVSREIPFVQLAVATKPKLAA
jgi:ubiquinone/menaquinone biosynthesis C-methylase UbiE